MPCNAADVTPMGGRGQWSKRRRVGTEKVPPKKNNSESEKPGPSRGVPSNNAETQGALTNHLILKEVFKHLPVVDLLNFSLVNKFWNLCASTVLRENKKCVAFIRRDYMCLDLKDLNDLLGKAVNIPFNGLSISTDWECCHSKYHIQRILKNPSTFYSNLVDMLTFKYFDIKVEGEDWREGQCPGEIIMKEIIKNSAEKLEGLSIPDFNDKSLVSRFLDLKDDEFYFPKLKYLEMPTIGESISTMTFRSSCDYSYIGRQLLQAAPNVKNITGWVSPLHLEVLAKQNQLVAVREFDFEFRDHDLLDEEDDPEDSGSEDEDKEGDGGKKYKRKYSFEQILQISVDCVSSLQNLTKLSISTIYFPRLLTKNKERWFPVISEIYTGLLSNSSDTLLELRVYQLDLVLLSRLKLPPLHRIRSIELIYVPTLSWTLTKFNCSQLFPNVTSVTVELGDRGVAADDADFYITEQMYGSKSLGNESYTWDSVTDFTYDGCNDKQCGNTPSTKYWFDPRLPKAFPNVKSVTLRECDRVTPACRTLWTAWPEVESIAFLDLPGRVIYNCFDHCFSGMTQDQSDIVWDAISDGKDVSDLIEKYQTLPSIRNLTKLKSFRVEFFHRRANSEECYHNQKNSDELFITEVTKKCALDFMPSLNFEIHGNTCKIPGKQCCYTFKHLEPNVKLFIT